MNEHSIVADWLDGFNNAIAQGTAARGLCAFFVEDAHFRNVVGLDWKFETISGRPQVTEYLVDALARTAAGGFGVHPDRLAPRASVFAGEPVIEAALAFDAPTGPGIGLLRLREDDDGRYRAWSIMLAPDTARTAFARGVTADVSNSSPDVLVVGGGHAGLTVAVELGRQGVQALVVDPYDRVGDNWRTRYQSLKLHNRTPSNHLAHMPFDDTWPDYIDKDSISDWLEHYADTMGVSVQTNTALDTARYDEATRRWDVSLRCGDGSNRRVKPRHIVMATSISSVANRPVIPTMENFQGPVLHSSEFTSSDIWRDRPVTVFGTGTSAHDICQDLHRHGARVTMVQRSPSLVVNLEPSAQLYDQVYYGDGPPLEDRDLLNSSVALPMTKKAHRLLTDQARAMDAPLLERLEAVGFRLEFGEDGTGWPLKYRGRGGGYYFNAGCSELIANREIGLLAFSDIEHFTADGLHLRDGAPHLADLIVLATGYKGPEYTVRTHFGDAVADRVGPVWGFDDETQELRNMWTRTAQTGLWFTGGSFSQCRIYSRYLAIQIKWSLSAILSRPAVVA